MRKEELANIIHEYNLPCMKKGSLENPCELCFRIAGQILIQLSAEFQHEGCKRRTAMKATSRRGEQVNDD